MARGRVWRMLRELLGRGGRPVRLHLRHEWRDIEVIGRVHVQECATCRRTRIRIR